MSVLNRKKKSDPISRAFRQDFPEFVDRAKALGVRITLNSSRKYGRVYWLDGYRQLTGYTEKRDGSPFTHEDAVRNIDKALTEIEEDRQTIASMSVSERFARIVAQFRKMEPYSRMIGEVRMPCGDTGYCFFNAAYDGGIRLHGMGEVAKAKAEWQRDESCAAHMARFCDMLEADFLERQ